jgi:hypothetical protein
MPYNENKKKSNKAWDKDNMRKLATGIQKEQAKQFQKYCDDQGKSVHTVLKEYVLHCINTKEAE